MTRFSWKKELGSPLLTEPSIGSGYLFLPIPDGDIMILDVESGEKAGVLKVDGPVTVPVALSDSIIILNEYGKRLVASNWITGHRLWAVELYGSDFAPLIFDGRVFWHDGRRNIICFDLKEGKRLWGISVDYDITAPPSACSLGVIFVTDRGYLECMSPRDGSPIWSLETNSRIKNAPAITGAKVVYCTVDGKVVLSSMGDGRPIWNIDLEMPVLAPLSVDGEGVYIGAQGGEILRLNISDGRMAWSAHLDGPIKGGSSILGNIVIFPTLNHRIFFVDKNEGKVIFDYSTFGMISSRPVVCSDRVFVAGEDENLYCFKMLRKNE